MTDPLQVTVDPAAANYLRLAYLCGVVTVPACLSLSCFLYTLRSDYND